MTRTDIVLALRARIAAATPELSDALAWIETTDHATDPVDALMAETNAVLLMSEQPDSEPTLTDLECAAAEGALMTEEMWDEEEDNVHNQLDLMMEILRGGGQ